MDCYYYRGCIYLVSILFYLIIGTGLKGSIICLWQMAYASLLSIPTLLTSILIFYFARKRKKSAFIIKLLLTITISLGILITITIYTYVTSKQFRTGEFLPFVVPNWAAFIVAIVVCKVPEYPSPAKFYL